MKILGILLCIGVVAFCVYQGYSLYKEVKTKKNNKGG